MTNLNNKEYPKENPDLIFELDEEAKLTDYIKPSNISAKGLLINEKIKKLIENFNIIEHRIYSATLFSNKQALNYYWLHLIKKDHKEVDFENSDFIQTDLFYDKIKTVYVNSVEDYHQHLDKARKDVNLIIPEKLILKEEYRQIDILFFPLMHQSLIASERFIRTLKKNNITGFEYEEASFIS
jgi:hypothetical protein